MKSVGEVMAMGRTFQESLQKALRGLCPLECVVDLKDLDDPIFDTHLAPPFDLKP